MTGFTCGVWPARRGRGLIAVVVDEKGTAQTPLPFGRGPEAAWALLSWLDASVRLDCELVLPDWLAKSEDIAHFALERGGAVWLVSVPILEGRARRRAPRDRPTSANCGDARTRAPRASASADAAARPADAAVLTRSLDARSGLSCLGHLLTLAHRWCSNTGRRAITVTKERGDQPVELRGKQPKSAT